MKTGIEKASTHLKGSLMLMVAAALLLGLTAPAASVAQEQDATYKVIDLGVLPGGTQSQAIAINKRGEVAGSSDSTGNSQPQAVLWRQGITYPLAMPNGFKFGVAKSINDQGRIAGLSSANGGPPYRAILWIDGVITNLGTLGGKASFAAHINNRSQIVGSSRTAANLQHAYVWQDGVMADLGTLPGGIRSVAWGINEYGQITGEASTSGAAVLHAFIWQNGAMQDIGTLGGSESIAFAINNWGEAVGQADLTGDNVFHAFIFDNDESNMIDLGVLSGGSNSLAMGINDRGQVVGGSDTADSPEHAFLFHQDEMTDLNNFFQRILDGCYRKRTRLTIKAKSPAKERSAARRMRSFCYPTRNPIMPWAVLRLVRAGESWPGSEFTLQRQSSGNL